MNSSEKDSPIKEILLDDGDPMRAAIHDSTEIAHPQMNLPAHRAKPEQANTMPASTVATQTIIISEPATKTNKEPDTTNLIDVDGEDRQLIQQIARSQDTNAMELLYQRYQPRLIPFLRRLTHDHALIEEVYNDVMFKIWQKASQFRGQSKVSSWIFSIAYRDCLRLVRRQKFRLDKLNELFLDESPSQTNNADNVEIINLALHKLSAKQRLTIELCYFYGYTMDEIALIVDCPVNTVKTRLHHARQKIRNIVDKYERAN